MYQIVRDPLYLNFKQQTQQELKKIPDFILRLLFQRGFQSLTQIKEFLYPPISSLSDPFTIMNMDQAVNRLITALDKKQKIAIYGDYDLDGTFGLAVLFEGLTKLGYKNLIPVQPLRHRDGYGFHSSYVQKLKREQDVNLIVTVDVGITSIEACLTAKDLGVDVIITDHHLGQGESPQACILNPNQPGDSSGLKYLCGAGVGLFLIRALRKQLMESGYEVNLDIKDLLPYFAVATITDMVPLVQDNRLLLKFAFDSFKKVENKGINLLLKKLDLQNKKLDTEDIGIKLAPKINALGRLEKDKRPMDLLFLENQDQAEAFVDGLMDLNNRRRLLQEEGIAEVLGAIKHLSPEEIQKQNFLFFYSPQIHPGVTGLIANHFMNEFGVSCMIGSLDVSTHLVTASGRKPELSPGSLVEYISRIKNDRCDGGGHACAIGFEFHSEDFEKIYEVSNLYFKNLSLSSVSSDPIFLNDQEKQPMVFDLELSWKEVTFQNYLWIEFLEPFGTAFPEPRFLLKNISFLQLSWLKNKHFKLTAINSETNERCDFLLFNPKKTHKILLAESLDNFDIVVKIKKDKFRNQNKIQFLVEDISKHEFIKT